MYNGNGNKYGNGTPNGTPRGAAALPPLYLYIGIGLLVLLGIWLLSSFFRAGIEGYFTLVAGVLLVLGNLRDLIANPYAQRSNIALLNTLLGGGLIFYFLGRGSFPPIGGFWYIPAVLMLLIAAPLMIGRASVYAVYLGAARKLVGGVRRVVGGLTRIY
jgi:hypothetical protein